jgi:hypothetical protein
MRILSSIVGGVKRRGFRTGRRLLSKTPIWSLLRPQDIHLYSIGVPKTGTTPIARIFEASYRTSHESHLKHTINLAFCKLKDDLPRDEFKRRLLARDEWRRFKFESNALLIYFVSELADLFPDSIFLCAVRPPRLWVSSVIDQHLNHSEASSNSRTLHLWLYDAFPREQYPLEEAPLAEQGAQNLDFYLRFWNGHYRRTLDLVPNEQVLFVRTQNISTSLARIAQFVGIQTETLSSRESHINRTTERNKVLHMLDEVYVRNKIKTICRETVRSLGERLSESSGISELS